MKINRKHFGVIAVACCALAIGACEMVADATSPYRVTHKGGAPSEGVPAPTESRPAAYNYLPAVLYGGCSVAEYPLFDAVNQEPIEKTRPFLDALGVIQDYNLTGKGTSTPMEMGWEKAINRRYRLTFRQGFETSRGPRIGWVFEGESSIGGASLPGGGTVGILAALSDADYHILAFHKYRTHRITKTAAVPAQLPDTLYVDFTNDILHQVDRMTFTAQDAWMQPLPEGGK